MAKSGQTLASVSIPKSVVDKLEKLLRDRQKKRQELTEQEDIRKMILEIKEDIERTKKAYPFFKRNLKKRSFNAF